MCPFSKGIDEYSVRLAVFHNSRGVLDSLELKTKALDSGIVISVGRELPSILPTGFTCPNFGRDRPEGNILGIVNAPGSMPV
jgi:hypothetical protein